MKPVAYALLICLSALELTPQAELDNLDKQYAGDRFYHRELYQYNIPARRGKHYFSKKEVAEIVSEYRKITGLLGHIWTESKAEELGLTDIN
jgi:hypothetical protein